MIDTTLNNRKLKGPLVEHIKLEVLMPEANEPENEQKPLSAWNYLILIKLT